MKLIVYPDYDTMSLNAARLVGAQVRTKPKSILGLATGSTPKGLYRELIRLYNEEDLDFSEITAINLDEYLGLGPDHQGSYSFFMKEFLFDHINIKSENIHIPDGLTINADQEMENYESFCDSMPRDIQILGIGHNGHIAFCEPADEFAKHCHVAKLKDQTLDANSRFFTNKEEIPKQALSMGIKQILNARKIIMLINGEAKAEALKGMVLGGVKPQIPASILQLHPNCIVMADKAAAKLL